MRQHLWTERNQMSVATAFIAAKHKSFSHIRCDLHDFICHGRGIILTLHNYSTKNILVLRQAEYICWCTMQRARVLVWGGCNPRRQQGVSYEEGRECQVSRSADVVRAGDHWPGNAWLRRLGDPHRRRGTSTQKQSVKGKLCYSLLEPVVFLFSSFLEICDKWIRHGVFSEPRRPIGQRWSPFL